MEQGAEAERDRCAPDETSKSDTEGGQYGRSPALDRGGAEHHRGIDAGRDREDRGGGEKSEKQGRIGHAAALSAVGPPSNPAAPPAVGPKTGQNLSF